MSDAQRADKRWAAAIASAEAQFSRQLSELAERLATLGAPRLVLLAGPSASGKTTTVERLVESLQREQALPAIRLSLDDYYRAAHEVPRQLGSDEPDWECVGAIDVARAGQDIQDLLAGRSVRLPRFDFKTSSPMPRDSGPEVRLPSDGVLIVEGIHSLHPKLREALPPELRTLRVYAAPTHGARDRADAKLGRENDDEANLRLARRIARGQLHRAASPAKTLAQWGAVRRADADNLEPFRSGCDVFINTFLPYEPAVLRHRVEPALLNLLQRTDEQDPQVLAAARELMAWLRRFPAAGAARSRTVAAPEAGVPAGSILREFIGAAAGRQAA